MKESQKKRIKKVKKKSDSSKKDSGSNKKSQSYNQTDDQRDFQNEQVDLSDDIKPWTSKKKKNQVHMRVESSASDADTQINAKEKKKILKQSSPS